MLYTSETISLQLTTVGYNDSLRSFSGLGTDTLNSLDNVQALNDLAEDDVATIEPWSGDSANEELRSVGVGTSVSHGKDTGTGVLVDEVLISELGTVDGLTTSSVGICEITALEHELRNDSVKDGSLEVKGLSALSHSLLSSAEGSEVLRSLRDSVSEQLHHDASSGLIADGDVEENLWVGHDLEDYYLK